MANTIKMVVGNVGRINELKKIGEDNYVMNVDVVDTPRMFDKSSNEWKDGNEIWTRVVLWGRLAKNADSSINIGDRVFAYGRETQGDKFEGKNGEMVNPRPQLTADFFGLDLQFASAKSDRKPKKSRDDVTSDSSDEEEAPARKRTSSSSSKRTEKKPAKKTNFDDDDLDDLDFDFDSEDSDDEEIAF